MTSHAPSAPDTQSEIAQPRSRRWPARALIAVVCLAFAAPAGVAAANLTRKFTGRIATGATYANDYFGGATPGGVIFDGTTVWEYDAAGNHTNSYFGTTLGGYNAAPAHSAHGLAFDGTYMWTVGADTVYRLPINTTEHVVGYPLPVGSNPGAVGVGGGYVWSANQGTHSVSVLTAAGSVSKTFTLPVECLPSAMAFDGRFVWAAAKSCSSLFAFDSTNLNLPYASVTNPGHAPRSIVYDGIYIWTANDGKTLSRYSIQADSMIPSISKDDYSVDRPEFFGDAAALDQPGYAASAPTDPNRYLWFANTSTNTLSKVDVTSGEPSFVASYPVATAPVALAFDGTNLWVSQSKAGTVAKIRVR